MKRVVFILCGLVLIFALWHYRYVFTVPKCVQLKGTDVAVVENGNGYIDSECDAGRINTWLSRHDFEYSHDKIFDRVYVR